jgi:hypothetical protein
MLRTPVFLLPLAQDLPELRRRIIAAISEINHDMLQRVWAEMDYRLDVCRVTKGGYLEHLWGVQRKRGEFVFISVSLMSQSFPLFKCTDFMKFVRELWITLYNSYIKLVRHFCLHSGFPNNNFKKTLFLRELWITLHNSYIILTTKQQQFLIKFSL